MNSIHSINYVNSDKINNLKLIKSLKDFEVYIDESELNNNKDNTDNVDNQCNIDNNTNLNFTNYQLFIQKVSNVPIEVIKTFFNDKYKQIRHDNLLNLDGTILINNNKAYIKYEPIEKSYTLLSNYIRIDKDLCNNPSKQLLIVKNIILSYLELKDKIKFLIINPDKILINKDLNIKFVETGLYSYLFEESYYNYENYDYFNFFLPIYNIDVNSCFSSFDYVKNNLYSLVCMFYFIFSGRIPYDRLIDKKINEDIFSNSKKFDFNNKNIIDNDIFDFFNTLPNKDINNKNVLEKIYKIINGNIYYYINYFG